MGGKRPGELFLKLARDQFKKKTPEEPEFQKEAVRKVLESSKHMDLYSDEFIKLEHNYFNARFKYDLLKESYNKEKLFKFIKSCTGKPFNRFDIHKGKNNINSIYDEKYKNYSGMVDEKTVQFQQGMKQKTNKRKNKSHSQIKL